MYMVDVVLVYSSLVWWVGDVHGGCCACLFLIGMVGG